MTKHLTSIGLGATAALLVGGTASSQIGFAPKVDYPIASTPDQIAIGDWDGDGDLDLASTCDGPERVAFHFNDGNGLFTFGYNLYLTSNSIPKGITAGDLDGDGDPDLVVVAYGHDMIHTIENLGYGAFALADAYDVSHGATYVIAAPLDGDGDLDLAVSCRDSGRVDILRNLGGGIFGSRTSFAAGSDTRGLCAADLDGDADLDLAIASHDSEELLVLKNNGSASFSSHVHLSMAPLKPESVVAADLDGDGDLDLATAGWSVASDSDVSELALFFQASPGTFADAVTYPTLGTDPSLLFAADFDLDADFDLAVVNENSDDLSVFTNDGAGVLGVAQLFATGNDPGHLCGADFDANGSIDLVTTNEAGGSISVLMNVDRSAFTDLGFALTGGHGDPTLVGIGTLEAGMMTTVEIGRGLPGAVSFFVVGYGRMDAAFAGGVFVPTPDVILPCVLDAEGAYRFQETWPDLFLTADDFYFQAWILDPAGPRNFAATNALGAIVP